MMGVMKSIPCVILTTFMSLSHAHDFPTDLVQYTCNTETFYLTTALDTCIAEQHAWFSEASMTDFYESEMWYGYRHNWTGEVVGVDFKKVVERTRWLSR